MLQLNRIVSSVDKVIAAAGPPPKPPLASIERGYQVTQDRVETWSPKLLGFVTVI